MRKYWWIIGGIGLAAILTNKKTTSFMETNALKLHKLFTSNFAKIRKDIAGDGHYGASRSNGTRKHAGVDLEVSPGQSILAPFKAKIIREAYPYASDLSYHGIYLQSLEDKNIKVKMFYLKKLAQLKPGDIIESGDPIALAENIASKYSKHMTPHIHVEVYQDNKRVNPENYL
ncbi:MAG: M23 family metallopeptidase [Bacteroidetes bacterium]|jgi:murein DD-endopeptidase MepM/ murein hydrolase activator NlpD|nr:M23 family metallopeptidase [Bacteroidota bacterium]MBT4339568.1 M23 family metallopeptidase [Bacteroidota bacterium]MBT4728625.1 M23 family metallopeptidase [Bacteroidota bacterium]